MDAKQTQGEPRLLISRSALLHNALLLRRIIGDDVKLWAMVKADAYGHGAHIVADTLCNCAPEDSATPLVDQLAVASIEEAILLPDCGVPVTVLRPIENTFVGRQRSLIETAILAGWTLTIISAPAADDVARIAQACNKRASVQIMLDTGMTRCGAAINQLEALLSRIESHATLRLSSIGTHFASSEDQAGEFTIEQLRHFRDATDDISEKSGKRRIPRHAANSGGIFFSPESHLDAVRPGISLYGIDPTCKPNLHRNLRPVMKWTAPLLAIHDVKKGTSVGYNQTWRASRDTKIGLVPVGYADGYLREYSNRAVVLLHGVTCPVVGRVSMDLTTIDLHDVKDAAIGDEVTILDNDPLSPCSVYALAKLGNTIPYEIFCRIGPRVQRVAVEPEDVPSETSDLKSQI